MGGWTADDVSDARTENVFVNESIGGKNKKTSLGHH
jgi:hypothetical protein